MPSPRGWGHPADTSVGVGRSRAIPTRVGTSISASEYSARMAGHPHAGGDIQNKHSSCSQKHGPSPRGWGHLGIRWRARLSARAIPTRVGTSSPLGPTSPASPGHPHAGGDICSCGCELLDHCGPSPRGWGHLARVPRIGVAVRAIPTRVGTSKASPSPSTPQPGHPHAGGDIVGLELAGDDKLGPSPRGWGHPHVSNSNSSPVRAIPTRVGTSAGLVTGWEAAPGHPHAGGDIWGICFSRYFGDGPSPRGWGHLTPFASLRWPPRAIPTRVGTSLR
jgi:hypothetical protein